MAIFIETRGASFGPPRTHRNEFPAEYSLASCSPAALASLSLPSLFCDHGPRSRRTIQRMVAVVSIACLTKGRSPPIRVQHPATPNNFPITMGGMPRECLAIEVDSCLSSHRVTRVLEGIIQQRSVPDAVRCNNGPEFTSRHFPGLVRRTQNPPNSIFNPAGRCTTDEWRASMAGFRILHQNNCLQ